ncbi:MAG TPA: Na+/H+ antiporter NhaA [Opitutaceae bacterium]|nr:Na+/H+ antiporter NhaA [Opitutaceae bacterium]
MNEQESSKVSGPPRTHGMREIRAEGSHLNRQVLLPAERFIHSETIGGALLLVCAIVALAWANSPWSQSYFAFRDTPVSFQFGSFSVALDLQHWINDGLMAVFFFVVALEIKRELVFGDLTDKRKAALPVAAALGGMIAPAGLYLALNFGGKGAAGWGIPMATDIAFALAILALLGRRVPLQLRMFLLTFAIVDDVGAIGVIAIYYTEHFSLPAMGLAIAILGLMLAMRWLGFRSPMAYVLPAVIFWAAMLKSGVHATVAGVILGAITPAISPGRKSTFVEAVKEILPDVPDSPDREDSERNEIMLGRIEEMARQTESPLERLERMVHPWTSYLVLPLFALVNAGVALSGEFIRQAFTSAVTLGVILGLVVGKAVGVTAFAWLAVRLGWAALPGGVTWRHITGAALIGGVGFTVSLFITGLAFTEALLIEEAKVGVLAASLIAGLGGYLVLLLVSRGSKPGDEKGSGA